MSLYNEDNREISINYKKVKGTRLSKNRITRFLYIEKYKLLFYIRIIILCYNLQFFYINTTYIF